MPNIPAYYGWSADRRQTRGTYPLRRSKWTPSGWCAHKGQLRGENPQDTRNL